MIRLSPDYLVSVVLFDDRMHYVYGFEVDM
jgi:hypothetical protein